MANSYQTLADVAALDAGIGYPVIDESVVQFPELSIFPATTMPGTVMEVTVFDTLPVAEFRNVNEGTDRKSVAFKTKVFSTAIIDHQLAVDKALVKSSKDQVRFLENITKPHMAAVMAKIAQQLWNGTSANKGFDGLYSQYAADSTHEIDATGTTAKTSVWLINLGSENCELVFGEGQGLTQREWTEETIYDANGKPFRGLSSSIFGRVGFRLTQKHSALRIKNLGTDTGKGLTDSLIYAAMQKFEEVNKVQPNAIFGTPRSFEQLRLSRSAVGPTGQPVSRIPSWEGIPVYRTTNLSQAE
jgi:hypothetical protein